MFEEYGDVKFSKGEKFPKGLVLRSKKDRTVVLEEYLDDFKQDVDVLHVFGKSYSLQDKEDLDYCLSIAREYEKNLTEPIHVFLENETGTETAPNDDRADQIARIVASNCTHYWNVILPIRN